MYVYIATFHLLGSLTLVFFAHVHLGCSLDLYITISFVWVLSYVIFCYNKIFKTGQFVNIKGFFFFFLAPASQTGKSKSMVLPSAW